MFGKSPAASGRCILSHPPQALALFYQANWKSPKTSFQHTHTHTCIYIYVYIYTRVCVYFNLQVLKVHREDMDTATTVSTNTC